MDITRRTEEENIFSAENIRNCEKYVFSIQQRLDRAVATNNAKRIRHNLNLLTHRSIAVKILAVYHICIRNKGKNTAGVDGISIPKGNTNSAKQLEMELLKEINIMAKPKAIKRVYIPKPNGKKRPLGIPTLKDRITQEIIRIALEPIVEYHSHDNSFGFRPKRSCHDAIQLIFNKLANRNRPRYIIEGDIKGCFDNISHAHIVNILNAWQIPSYIIRIIKEMLKAKIFYNGNIYDNDTGTPQGGVISPMLANVALTSLDNHIEKKYGWKTANSEGITITNPLVRYADDFVIICKSKTIALEIKEEIKRYLQKNIGLELSEEKTKITHINKGFNFLGFNIKKHKKYKNKPCEDISDYRLLIRPEKEKILNILDECKQVIDNNKTAKQNNLIYLLNPKIVGWANYYRYVVSSTIFHDIDYILWNKTLKWTKRIHSEKRIDWIIKKYYSRQFNSRILDFTDKDSKVKMATMRNIFSSKRFIKVKNGMRVYNAEHAGYWKKRERLNAQNQLYSSKLRRIFDKQKGHCPYCKSQIKESEISKSEVHIHHMLPHSFGGKDNQSNLRLLHTECHNDLHKRFSRQEMNDMIKVKRLDYIKAF